MKKINFIIKFDEHDYFLYIYIHLISCKGANPFDNKFSCIQFKTNKYTHLYTKLSIPCKQNGPLEPIDKREKKNIIGAFD